MNKYVAGACPVVRPVSGLGETVKVGPWLSSCDGPVVEDEPKAQNAPLKIIRRAAELVVVRRWVERLQTSIQPERREVIPHEPVMA